MNKSAFILALQVAKCNLDASAEFFFICNATLLKENREEFQEELFKHKVPHEYKGKYFHKQYRGGAYWRHKVGDTEETLELKRLYIDSVILKLEGGK